MSSTTACGPRTGESLLRVAKNPQPFQNMIFSILPTVAAKVILRGIHLDLTDATRASIETKTERLFRHEPQILRLRIDVERSHGGGAWLFTAKGHIEIGGPDLQASVTTENAYKSVNLLIDKLDRMLRKRAIARRADRFTPVLSGAN